MSMSRPTVTVGPRLVQQQGCGKRNDDDIMFASGRYLPSAESESP